MTASRLVAGASGYSFKEWKRNFYPEKMKPEEMLAWYSERSPTLFASWWASRGRWY